MTDDLHHCSAHHLVSSHLIREEPKEGGTSLSWQSNIHLEEELIDLFRGKRLVNREGSNGIYPASADVVVTAIEG
ncbi:hypothetical protein TNCV_5078851 [Trichonephila clavipes]|nr:hypothetical protein TNCV_5078851 [Trichonephila clavipes]